MADDMPWDHFLVGVNYWPKRKAMYWWKHFSADEVRQEFEQIKELNLEAVRFFLLWEDFQPESYKVDTRQMNNLEKVLEIAHDLKLRCVPTLFTGHMSGFNWLPHWTLGMGDNQSGFPLVSNDSVLDRYVKPLFSDQAMIEAQALQARTLSAAFAKHPAILFWDTGNEASNVQLPPSEEAAAEWGARLAEALRGPRSDALVSQGLQARDVEQDRRIGPRTAAESCDFLCMHGYPGSLAWAKGPLDSNVCPFLNVLSQSLGGKPVLFEEVGLPMAQPGRPGHEAPAASATGTRLYLASEDEAAGYYQEVLEKLWSMGSLGAFAWCYGDYDSSLFGVPPCDTHPEERSFGLVRADGSLKPAAEVVRRFAAERRPLRSMPANRPYSGLDGYYRELPRSLTERFEAFQA